VTPWLESDIPGLTATTLEQRIAAERERQHRPRRSFCQPIPTKNGTSDHVLQPTEPWLRQQARRGANFCRRIGLSGLVPLVKRNLPPELLQQRPSVAMASLTALDDELFVSATLRSLLQREPAPTELASWLGMLRSGRMAKSELVSLVRLSPEGRAAGITVQGLWPKALLWQACRLPLLGRLLRFLLTAAMLPALLYRLRALEQLQQRQAAALHNWQQAAHQQLAANAARNEALATRDEELATRDEELAEAIRAGQQRADQRDALLRDQQQRLDELSLDAGIGLELDGFYALFEQAARGTQDEIRERQRVYLPYAEQAAKATGCSAAVDIGSGRGEWLQLLQQAGLQGLGAEINRIFVEESRSKGLDVADEDGISLLRRLPAESLCLVTAFQVVEHLSFGRLLQLLQAAYAALRPGGCIILETPNPASLLVGCCSFYSDPTHQRPLVPSSLEFILMAQGFRNMQLVTLHPPAEQLPCRDDDPLAPLAARWNAGQDYAVIAYKPAGGAL